MSSFVWHRWLAAGCVMVVPGTLSRRVRPVWSGLGAGGKPCSLVCAEQRLEATSRELNTRAADAHAHAAARQQQRCSLLGRWGASRAGIKMG
ncbi:hypothetical protein BDU57DRAFT_516334 [Ampelomyces quisqualis]|uniref:Secreted protein n=1 Tax=Ampelomyces quisqualis TaxID=50730 RepID=A0A6A5QKP9_AMPQU|nr:hypothetical protein BDU57DRAFT_516334 [Ampelomyces quisqualis]